MVGLLWFGRKNMVYPDLSAEELSKQNFNLKRDIAELKQKHRKVMGINQERLNTKNEQIQKLTAQLEESIVRLQDVSEKYEMLKVSFQVLQGKCQERNSVVSKKQVAFSRYRNQTAETANKETTF